MKKSRGYSLIELVVVAAVMVIVSSIVLVNNARFGGAIKLENFAYDVALTLRQAQVYGISVNRSQSGFTAGYGVHIDMSGTYVLFADAITKNGMYDCVQPGTSNCELVQTTTMTGNYSIKQLCTTSTASVETCSSAPGSTIDIDFIRPESNAWISVGPSSCIQSGSACQLSARIQLQSPRGQTIDVVVDSSGQISVKRVAG